MKISSVSGFNSFKPVNVSKRNDKSNQHNEVIVVNRKTIFGSVPKVSQTVADHLGINMECAVVNPAKPAIEPAPISIGEKLANFLNNMEVDWRTHVDPNVKSRMFE